MSYKANKKVQIRYFLNEILPEKTIKKIKMFDNHKTSFILIKNLKIQNCTKHIDIIYYYI